MILEPINREKDIVPEPYPMKELLHLIEQEQLGNLFTYLTPKEYSAIVRTLNLE